jgi:class 3 adenylate cyclase
LGRGNAMNGVARQEAVPSGVVTFLFTDIEGSTRRWEAYPEVMRVALADHDEVLRGAIEAHGGWVFRHTGNHARPPLCIRFPNQCACPQ